ncbi:MAG: hypothetical protein H5U04_12785 [Firmicutes bacterium]|nr:hypothetical protein [Bacillota bacterium]
MDPCREDLHRLLMVALVADGRRAEALQQYRWCPGYQVAAGAPDGGVRRRPYRPGADQDQF